MKSRLLIVDDRPENLVVLGAVLDTNYDLIPAPLRAGGPGASGGENSMDVVLMDIEMPVMDGCRRPPAASGRWSATRTPRSS